MCGFQFRQASFVFQLPTGETVLTCFALESPSNSAVRRWVKSFNLYLLAYTNYIDIDLTYLYYILLVLSVDHYSGDIKFKMPSMNKRARLDTYILKVWHRGNSLRSDVLTVSLIIVG